MSWTETSLGNVCELYQPQTITTKDLLADGKYPVYGANGVIGRYDKYNHEDSQLLVTCRGATCGSVNVSEPFSWINGNAMVVKPKIKEIDVRFVEYFFRGAVDLTKAITGAAQPQITRQSLSPIKFNYPSLTTQQKIVEKLDAIFADIDRATVATQVNVKNVEALFQSYLTEVFERGDDGWKSDELGQITKFIDYRGKTPTKTDSGIRLITAKNVKFGFINKEPYEYIAESDYETWMTRGIPVKGDVLFTTEAPLANVAQLDTDEKVVFAQRLIILQSKHGILDNEFLKFSLLSKKIQEEIISKGTGATVKGIKASLLKKIYIKYPSVETQKEICKSVSTIQIERDKLKEFYSKRLEDLIVYKQSILKQAFNGELVKE